MATSKDPISRFFTDRRFRIPKYQRGYDWTTSEVNDFVQDIEYMMNDDINYPHYFGNIVIWSKKNRQSTYELIDGQQRITTISILYTCLIEQVKTVALEEENSYMLSEAEDWRKDYTHVKNKGKDSDYRYKVNVSESYEDVFKSIIDEEENIISKSECDNRSEMNLINTYDELSEWLIDTKSSIKVDYEDNWRQKFLDFLEDVATIVESDFEVTYYEIDDMLQAGRMFGVVNDRGRGLAISDKIKSHLVYLAAMMEDQEKIEEVHSTFTNVRETILGTEYNRDELDAFLDIHWIILTGENFYTTKFRGEDILQRIKGSDLYVDTNKEENRNKEFIDTYLDTLKTYSKRYASLRDKTYDNSLGHSNALYILSEFCDNKHNMSLAISIMENVSNQEDKNTLLWNLTSFVLITQEILNKGSTILRRKNSVNSNKLHWSNNSQNSVFNTTYEKESIKSTINDEVTTKINGSKDEFENKLKSDDVIGGDNTYDWSGAGRDIVKLLLMLYENTLRDPENRVGLSKYENIKSSSFDIEHIYPQNPQGGLSPEEEKEHSTTVGMLGNLLLLSFEDNIDASNKPYHKKKRDIYSTVDISMVNKLDQYAEDNEWTETSIEERTEEMAKEIKKKFQAQDL